MTFPIQYLIVLIKTTGSGREENLAEFSDMMKALYLTLKSNKKLSIFRPVGGDNRAIMQVIIKRECTSFIPCFG